MIEVIVNLTKQFLALEQLVDYVSTHWNYYNYFCEWGRNMVGQFWQDWHSEIESKLSQVKWVIGMLVNLQYMYNWQNYLTDYIFVSLVHSLSCKHVVTLHIEHSLLKVRMAKILVHAQTVCTRLFSSSYAFVLECNDDLFDHHFCKV